MRFPIHLRASRTLAGLILLGAACAGEGPTAPTLSLEVSGRAERGSIVDVAVTGPAGPLPRAEVEITADPAGAAERLADGRVRLLAAGSVTLRARAGSERGEVTITVASPPRVVFELAAGGNQDVYSAALDGGEPRRLTTAAALDVEPTSAAGRVVFVSARDGAPALYSVPIAGGTAQRLGAAAVLGRQPALSAAGDRIAFLREVGGLPRLWLANGEGGGAAAAPGSVAGSIDASPSFAPAGDRLVYTSTRGGGSDLWISPLTALPEPFVSHSATDVEPAWSPDGTRVAFVSTRDGNPELYLVTVATRVVTRLTNTAASEGQPAWLADGRIVFTLFEGNGSSLHWLDPATPAERWTIPTPTGTPTRAVAER